MSCALSDSKAYFLLISSSDKMVKNCLSHMSIEKSNRTGFSISRPSLKINVKLVSYKSFLMLLEWAIRIVVIVISGVIDIDYKWRINKQMAKLHSIQPASVEVTSWSEWPISDPSLSIGKSNRTGSWISRPSISLTYFVKANASGRNQLSLRKEGDCQCPSTVVFLAPFFCLWCYKPVRGTVGIAITWCIW